MFELKKILKPVIAAAFLALAPIAAAAMPISGQIDISGQVNLAGSDFSIGGNVDLLDPGLVTGATGDFASTAGFGDLVTLTDIDFAAPGDIWSVGGFTFTASVFTDIINGATNSFTALGTVIGNGFDVTSGILTFTAQSGQTEVSFSATTVVPLPAAGFLLVGALGGLGFLGRRRKKAA